MSSRHIIIAVSLLGFAAENGFCDEPYLEPPLTERNRKHWAWQPLRDTPVATPDSLLLEKLREAGIEGFSARADHSTLLRRLHFTLTGLPPSPEEIADFRAGEIEEVVDELLSRKSYGERWAQHWLDVARFAETDGFEHDKVRSEAWQYRDWVITALNRDLPYNEFIALQVAGDEIVGPDSPDRFATGFLLAGPDMPDINLEAERRHNVLNEMTGTLGSTILGLTLSCSQCHDHKTDPLSLADFYRLRAFFDNARMPAKGKSLPAVFAESGPTIATRSFLQIRGDFRRPDAELEPAFLRILNREEAVPESAPTETSSGRRRALAQWLCSPDNPLPARVIVNRVWQHHFGEGLVATPNDFGRTGERPTHPELLDWLALRFQEHGWSLKWLHRTLILTDAWQQTSIRPASDHDWDERVERDPDNQLLSRRVPIRMSGEEIRDAMLYASGKLNKKTGGPGVRPPLPAEVTVTLLKNQWEVTADQSEHYRRSIYLFLRRNLRYPIFDVFDKPDSNFSCGRRHPSTTAPQSLTLLNSEFSHARAADLVDRLRDETTEQTEQVRTAFLRTLGRPPLEEETRESLKFLRDAPLEEFALALFNLNEFVYLD